MFRKTIKVSFSRHYHNWYCDIPGWPEEYFANTLMVGDASLLLKNCAWNYSTKLNFEVKISDKDKDIPGYFRLKKKHSSLTGGAYYYLSDKLPDVWLCPVTLFVLGKYPENIYFKVKPYVKKIDGNYYVAPNDSYSGNYFEVHNIKEIAIRHFEDELESWLM